MTIKQQILKLWKLQGIVFDGNKKTAEKFAQAISEMDCEDWEKLDFAQGITKIYN
ncbi:MAG: hypothetical protein IKY15_01800 [Clostridia bacterium]|nr:hypothetical protein [Clostridia bacterium]